MTTEKNFRLPSQKNYVPIVWIMQYTPTLRLTPAMPLSAAWERIMSLSHLERVHVQSVLGGVAAAAYHGNGSRHAPKGVQDVHVHAPYLQHFL